MVEMVRFHFVFYSIFTVERIKIHAKMYSDSGCSGSGSVLFGKTHLWLHRRLR